jgi:hypothetical protein
VIVLVGCLILGALSTQAAAAGSCTQHVINENESASSCGELGWSYDPVSREFSYGSRVTASDDPDGSKFVYRLVAACDQGVDGGGGVCANFGNCAPRVGPDGDPLRVDRFQGVRALKGSGGRPVGPMEPFGAAICVYAGRSVPMAEVVAAVRDDLVRQVGRPVISVEPATRGLVGWPVLFSAPAQHPTALAIRRPLVGAITAVPAYTWQLGAGQLGRGAGHRYTDAVDPRSPASDGYYVKGIYETPGAHQVTVTLTWQASIHLGPVPGGLDVDLDPIVFTADATATVVSATNRLYSEGTFAFAKPLL